MLAIPLITLQAVVEVAVGGMLALFITDVTRMVTRGFLASTGGVLLVVGVIGVVGQYFLPDPSHLTEHAVNRAWLQPALRLSTLFMILFLLYLVAVYLRPPVLHVIIGLVATAAGLAAVISSANAFPTPVWGPYGSAVSFILSAITIGTVTTAMLLGHWYLVVPTSAPGRCSSSWESWPPGFCSRLRWRRRPWWCLADTANSPQSTRS